MPKMKPSELQAMLAAQKQEALSTTGDSTLSAERTTALNYYMGDMQKDLPAQEGRSRAVSSDVADTIEGLMPSLMDIFCGGDEVVRFEPVGPEDEQAAEQETDYVNHVFMQQNPGFLVLYSFIKDALLGKVGIVKVWWDKHEEEERETYLDQPEDTYAMLVAEPDIEVVEHTEHSDPDYPESPPLHDVTVVTKKTYQCARVEAVPPEEFGIAKSARSLRDATYAYHATPVTQDDLIQQGFDPAQVRSLPSYAAISNTETQARDSVHESSSIGESVNDSARLILVTEHYIRIDYDGAGKAKLYRVTTGGDQDIILKRDGKEDIEPFDMMPFAAITPVIITHRFFGRSVADLVVDIQRIKTALLRALLDNAYMANNPRVEVSQAHATDTTLDDLLVSRPGGVVRVKQPGGVNWQTVPNIGPGIYPLMEYMDATREWRTGVSKAGQGLDANALQNQTATAANQLFTAAQARMKLIARIFAETGIRDLFSLLHATIRKNGSQAQTVRLRNNWVTVDPREWKTRNDMTINVGLGTGGKQQQIANTTMLASFQKELLAGGKVNIVDDGKIYNTAKEMAKLLGHKNPDQFFNDPMAKDENGNLLHPTPPPQPDPKLIELQAKNQIEKTQAEADIATQERKTNAELALAERKAQLDERLMLEQHQMKMEEHRMAMLSKVASSAGKTTTGPDGETVQSGPDLSPLLMELVGALKNINAPKRVVRGPDGRVSHVEPIVQ